MGHHGLRAVLLGAILLGAGCASGTALPFEPDPSYAEPAAAPMGEEEALAALADWDERSRASDAPEASVVFIGKVLAVGRSPGVGSGVIVSTQPVRYEPREVLRGSLPEGPVIVHHLLLGAWNPDRPEDIRLSPRVYRVGAHLVVWASLGRHPQEPGGVRLTDLGSNPGPLPATRAVLARVRAAVGR